MQVVQIGFVTLRDKCMPYCCLYPCQNDICSNSSLLTLYPKISSSIGCPFRCECLLTRSDTVHIFRYNHWLCFLRAFSCRHTPCLGKSGTGNFKFVANSVESQPICRSFVTVITQIAPPLLPRLHV